jgi:hypothetical protein
MIRSEPRLLCLRFCVAPRFAVSWREFDRGRRLFLLAIRYSLRMNAGRRTYSHVARRRLITDTFEIDRARTRRQARRICDNETLPIPEEATMAPRNVSYGLLLFSVALTGLSGCRGDGNKPAGLSPNAVLASDPPRTDNRTAFQAPVQSPGAVSEEGFQSPPIGAPPYAYSSATQMPVYSAPENPPPLLDETTVSTIDGSSSARSRFGGASSPGCASGCSH